MKFSNRSTTFLVILFLALFLVVGGGCSSKKPAASKTSPQTKSTIEPTQRPYTIKGVTYYPTPSSEGYVERGKASWYGKAFHGKKTASGETYDMHGHTAAHKTLPMNTVLLVKNLDNGRATLVRVNDRGPFSKKRILDLSYAKAQELGVVGPGVARVEIVAIEQHAKGQKTPPILTTAPQRQAGQPAANNTASSELKPNPGKKIAKIKTQGARSEPGNAGQADNFYVQVGAFDDLHSARTMAKDFASRGRDVTIQQYPAAGMNFYRVLVFAGTSLNKARSFERQLKDDGFHYALLLAK